MKQESIIKQVNDLMTSLPNMFFASLSPRFESLSKIIWEEYLVWQKGGGKITALEIKETAQGDLYWRLGGDEFMGQRIDFRLSPFTKEQYKNGLSAVYSFMKDRPQYYKFRKMDEMFNPLRLLLYKFL